MDYGRHIIDWHCVRIIWDVICNDEHWLIREAANHAWGVTK